MPTGPVRTQAMASNFALAELRAPLYRLAAHNFIPYFVTVTLLLMCIVFSAFWNCHDYRRVGSMTDVPVSLLANVMQPTLASLTPVLGQLSHLR